MSGGLDWAVAPMQGRVARTVALASALFLGRREILAERLTLRSCVALYLLALAQLVFSLAGAWWAYSMLGRRGLPEPWQVALSWWSLVGSLSLWATHSVRVLGSLGEARRTAKRLRVVVRTDGVHVYDPPLQASYEEQLLSCLSLGVSRRWEGTLIGLHAPRLLARADQVEPEREWQFARWVWETQQAFEPGLLVALAFLSLLALHPLWFFYFGFAALSLARAASMDRSWFESVGRDRFREADHERAEFEEWRRLRRTAAEEDERRRYIVRALKDLARSPLSAKEAYEQLPEELKRMLRGDGGESPR